MKNKFIYLIFMVVSISTGGISAILTRGNMDIYDRITMPPLSPPSILFPIVWTVLYLLMGISAARIYIENNKKWSNALTVWSAQLFLNFVWSILFFNLHAFLFSFIWLIALLILIVVMIIKFFKYDRISSYLQIPYLLWVTFAGYLNFAIYLLN